MDTAPEIQNELSLVQIKRKESVTQNSLRKRSDKLPMI